MSEQTHILNSAEYKSTMAKLESLMLKGSELTSAEELQQIKALALAAQKYEKEHFIIEPPETLAGMIELKMYQLKIRQNELAKKLNISEAKLSLILNGKQKPDVAFLKNIYKELQITADFILEHA